MQPSRPRHPGGEEREILLQLGAGTDMDAVRGDIRPLYLSAARAGEVCKISGAALPKR